jgi:acyl-CoA reductase-like NAD-dependent aldehyde dehydrogenase
MPETNIKGVYWSEGREKFMENIKVALNESDDEIKQYRINEASKNTWEARAEQILQKIEELQ